MGSRRHVISAGIGRLAGTVASRLRLRIQTGRLLSRYRLFHLHFGLFSGLSMISVSSNAHVKWFADWNIICPPRDPMHVFLSPLWQTFFAACVLCMAALAWVDWHLGDIGKRLHDAVAPKAMDWLRRGMCVYWLMSAFTLPKTVYLTPELAAPAWVSWVQAACAILVLRRATAWLAGLGLMILYVLAIADYGWFHLLDYPLFFALGMILVLTGRGSRQYDMLGLSILRWSTALTLLWGGIEKFAYPEWSFDMLRNMPFLSLGVSYEAAMYMYGFGEVALSFGLLMFGVGSQVSAFFLLLIFMAAIPPFGWVDLVGHSGVCVALAILTLTRARPPIMLRKPLHNAATQGILFPGTIIILFMAYFGLHAIYIQ